MQPSELPVVDVPIASSTSGAFQRSASMRTQRASRSAVCGYSSLSTMFLSAVSGYKRSASSSIQVVTKVARLNRALPSSITSSCTIWYADCGSISAAGILSLGKESRLSRVNRGRAARSTGSTSLAGVSSTPMLCPSLSVGVAVELVSELLSSWSRICCRPSGSVAGLDLGAVHGQGHDDDDVERDHDHRPDRCGAQERDVEGGADQSQEGSDDPRPDLPREHAHPRDHHDHSRDDVHPSPSAVVGADEQAAAREDEVVVVEHGDETLDHVERARQGHREPREGDPPDPRRRAAFGPGG